MTTDAVVVDGHRLEEGTRVHHERLGTMRVTSFSRPRDEIRIRFEVLEVAASQWMAFRLDHVRAAWGDTLAPATVESTTDQEARADGGSER
jgi:hypothetical protein